MATLSIEGIEEKLQRFLETKDLQVRASAALTETCVAIVSGDAQHSVLKQHGLQVTAQGELEITVHESIFSKLLNCSKDACPHLHSAKEGSVLCTLPVRFVLLK
jgi:HSP90 family molecular chaperone